MKKVLIYMEENSLEKRGGPPGYNYALKTELDKMGVTHIKYLPGGKKSKHRSAKLRKSFWGNVLVSINDFIQYTKWMYFPQKESAVDLNQFDIVHFHNTRSLYTLRNVLKDYKGKVILSSHSPRVAYLELIGRLTPWSQKYLRWYYKKLKKLDSYAFNRADYIVFPCQEAEEPYMNTWSEFKRIKECKADRFRYVLTGTYECKAKRSREDVLEEYGIPNDAFVVSFAGRHNEIKGYDNLKEIGTAFLKKHSDAYFLIAGNEFPLKGLDHERWIEVGWTNDPHSIIAASDVFILPNKETYFDLVLLEVLSLGKIVVASNTGGNKYFNEDLKDSVRLYDGIGDAIDKIESVYNMSSDKRVQLGQQNQEYFFKYLTLESFAKNYLQLYESL